MSSTLILEGGYKRYNFISFLRAFSITTIVLMHLIQSHIPNVPTWLYKGASLGGTGVHAFFFCSGFGLFLSYKNKRTTFFQFVSKRFWKIYIPYIIVILILYFIPYIEVDGNRLSALLSHVFLYKMFVPEYYSSFGVFWFISTIIQFYLVFIPLCKIKEKIGNKAFCIVSVLISVIWWIVTGFSGLAEERVIGSFFFQYLWEFALGMLMADYLLRGKKIKINNWVLLVVAVLGIAIEGVLASSNTVLGRVFNDIPALFGYGALALLLYQISFIYKVLYRLESISYEWYLVHGLVFVSLSELSTALDLGLNKYVVAIVLFVVSIVTAYGYHSLIRFVRNMYGNKKKKKE